MENDFSIRLRACIKTAGLNVEEFGKKVRVSKAQMYRYLSRENTPTADFFQAVKASFPWVNIEWLITGIGYMNYQVGNEQGGVYYSRGAPADKVSELILLMLNDMPEEKRREVLKYAEGQKRLAELDAAESVGGKTKRRGAA